MVVRETMRKTGHAKVRSQKSAYEPKSAFDSGPAKGAYQGCWLADLVVPKPASKAFWSPAISNFLICIMVTMAQSAFSLMGLNYSSSP